MLFGNLLDALFRDEYEVLKPELFPTPIVEPKAVVPQKRRKKTQAKKKARAKKMTAKPTKKAKR